MNFSFKSLFILLILSLFSISAIGQQATVKGTLTDAEKNEPLPFANVVVDGTSSGATTDDDGKWEIRLDPGNYTFVFSYIGFDEITRELTLAANEERVIDIALGTEAELLEQVVVTTNKSGVKVGESTVSIAVIQPSLIENTNSTAVDEVVEKIPGVQVVDGQANIRGGSGYSYGAGSRVLLLVDDLPFLQGDAGFPNWRDVPVENLSQIEVLKGAASALYGSSAMNGIINVRTAYPTSDPVTTVSFYNTLYLNPPTLDTCKLYNVAACDTSGQGHLVNPAWWGDRQPIEAGAQFAHRQKYGNFDLVVGGNIFYQNNWRQEEYTRRGRLNVNTRYRLTDKVSFGVNANFNVGPSGSIFLWQDADQGSLQPLNAVPGLGITGLETNSTSKVWRYNLDPFVTAFDKYGNRHKVLSRYYFIRNNNNNNQSNSSKLIFGEYQFQRTFESLGGLNVVAGINATQTRSDSELFGSSSFKATNFAGYLQLDKKFFDKLSLSVGTRYERNTLSSPDSIVYIQDPVTYRQVTNTTETESKPVFRFGANYQPADYTFFRASWGQGYRFPTIAEKYISTSIGNVLNILPSFDLKSETGWSAEFGIRQGVKISTWQGFFDLSLFWTEYQDMMEFTFGGDRTEGDPLLFFRSLNVGDTRIRGAEISFIGKGDLFGVPTELLMGYTYIDPKFQEWVTDTTGITLTDEIREGYANFINSSSDQNVLKYRFKHSFKIDVQSTFFKKLDVGLSIQHYSFMEAIDQFFEEAAIELFPGVVINADLFGLKRYRDNNRGGNTVVDARMAYHITDHAKVSLLVKNLANRYYFVRPALTEAPINLTLRFDYKFGGK